MTDCRSVRGALATAEARLQRARIPSARQEAEALLGGLLSLRRSELYLESIELQPAQWDDFLRKVDTRASGRPLQYIQGNCSFMGQEFIVRPDVFVPRPETELLVEKAIELLRIAGGDLANPLVGLDLGTGSGVIAVSLAKFLPTCAVIGIDVSYKAICLAQENAARSDVVSRTQFVCADWVDCILGPVDFIVSNPPYLPESDAGRLPREVTYDPRQSLFSGTDGTDALFQILKAGERLLKPGGIMACECSESQAGYLVDQIRQSRAIFSCDIYRDMAGRPRGFWLRKGPVND